jgi:hypothetical protein
MDVIRNAAFIALAACATAPTPPPPAAPAPPPPVVAPRAPDPDLHRTPPPPVLAIDWAGTPVDDDAAAIALWRAIAPTGADWEDKLHEVPASHARPLALALLRAGNFTCVVPATGACAKPAYDVPAPSDAATLDDPCLRRRLAMWALEQLEPADVPAARDALLAIAAIPPPESELVEAVLRLTREVSQDERLAILAVAWTARQHDLVNAAVGPLDEAHLFAAVQKHHIAGALDVLSPEAHRAAYLAAVTDEALAAKARISAITELAAKPSPELTRALIAATRARDCSVAAAATRALHDPRYLPTLPRTTNPAVAMRALCVLASYEGLQAADEPSLLASYLPARGLERTTITYDPLSTDDPDGDGDVHTAHAADLVPRAEAVLPEREDLVRAFAHCTGTICVSDDHEFRFVWKPAGGGLQLTRIDLADRPPC